MKPPRFEYYDPATVEEALSLLRDFGDEAKVLAGGQSLVPILNMRLAHPKALIDINRIQALQQVQVKTGVLELGACTRQCTLEEDPVIRQSIPLLAEVVRYIGHEEIRHRGTVGGSIAHADPAAELPAVAVALDAEIEVSGPNGKRIVPARNFFHGIMTTDVQPDELLTAVRFPIPPLGTGWGFAEVARRHGDFALAATVALVRLGKNGMIEHVAVALAGISDRPIRATQLEESLLGVRPTRETIEEACTIVSSLVEFGDDLHATLEYRREIARVVTKRALMAAIERCRRSDAA